MEWADPIKNQNGDAQGGFHGRIDKSIFDTDTADKDGSH